MTNVQSKHNLDETLSALVDGETSDLELRQVLKALDEDNNAYSHLRDKWKNAHQAGAVLRSEDLRFADMDISSRVSMALEGESIDVAPSSKPKQAAAWKEIWAKSGIAAAVALGVLFTFQITQDDTAVNSQIASSKPVEQVQPSAPEWFQQAPIATRAASVSGGASSDANRSAFERHHNIDLNTQEQLELRVQQILQEHAEHEKVAPR